MNTTQDSKMLFDSMLSTLEMELRASLDTCVTGMVATARTQLEAALAEVAKERAKGLAEVARERAELHREIEAMQTHTEAQEGRVELNIGGRRFETSVQTLRRVPHTFFDAYFSGRYAQDVCADGSIFVDRDGEHFDHVLEYMRDGVVSVATQDASELDVSLLRALKREFGFYCIELMAEPEEVIFVVGGQVGDLIPLSVLERYDNASRVWLEKMPMMTPRSCFTLCEVGGLLYAAGGLDGEGGQLASVECYDPILDTWSVAPALPRSRLHHGGCAVGDSLYILGGMEGIVGDEYSLDTTSVLKFDSGTQAWSEVAPMPEARANFVACVLHNDIYVVGGFGDDNPTDNNFCYNTVTNVWSTLAPIPDTKLGHSVCVVFGRIYVLGGRTTLDQAMASSVHRFDPVTNVWSAVAPMSTPRCALTSFVLGGCLHAAGGFDGVDDLSSVERYNAVSDSWERVRSMELSGPRLDFGSQVMTLEMGLFDSLEKKARCARS
jgi:hypothetical protein